MSGILSWRDILSKKREDKKIEDKILSALDDSQKFSNVESLARKCDLDRYVINDAIERLVLRGSVERNSSGGRVRKVSEAGHGKSKATLINAIQIFAIVLSIVSILIIGYAIYYTQWDLLLSLLYGLVSSIGLYVSILIYKIQDKSNQIFQILMKDSMDRIDKRSKKIEKLALRPNVDDTVRGSGSSVDKDGKIDDLSSDSKSMQYQVSVSEFDNISEDNHSGIYNPVEILPLSNGQYLYPYESIDDKVIKIYKAWEKSGEYEKGGYELRYAIREPDKNGRFVGKPWHLILWHPDETHKQVRVSLSGRKGPSVTEE